MDETISRRLRIRSMHCDDGPALDAVFAGLSKTSRYLRFHRPMPRLRPAERDALLALDGHSRVALLAEVRELGAWRPAGIARLVASVPDVPSVAGGHAGRAVEAELAIEIADRWQGRGIGAALLIELRELAVALGYVRLNAEVLAENAPMLHLLRRLFLGTRTSSGHGVLHLSCPLGLSGLPLDDADLYADLLGH